MINWIRNLRLSLAQWGLLSASALIGLLVALLRIRGGQLHRTQVDLLAANLGRAQDKQDAAVEAARERYKSAKKAYKENK